MRKEVLKRSILIWFLFIPVAILNGTVRNFVYKPLTGDLLAHQISTVTASALFIILAYLLLKNKLKNSKRKELFSIGLIWIMLTILFEFGFGHFVMGNSWEKLFHDYNILQGRIWILVLATELITPFVVKRLIIKSKTT